jgi:hypothetical protein
MRKGRELEIIVEALERCFAPADADIKSPDAILDRVTGTLREVDVSIRYKIGSVPILVILECRDQSATQDVTWIEQLAKKRDDVRASRAVAVSSSGFSEAARLKAAHDAIDLRTVSELTTEVVLGWCAVPHTIGGSRNTNLTHVAFEFAAGVDTSDPEIRASLHRADGRIDIVRNVFRSQNSGQLVSVSSFWWAAVDQHDLFKASAADGTRQVRKFHLSFDAGERYCLVAGDRQYEIVSIALTAETWIDQTQHSISRALEYTGADGTNIQTVQFEIPVQGKDFVVSLYSDVQNSRTGASLRRNKDDGSDATKGA